MSDLYYEDILAWSERQGALVRARRLSQREAEKPGQSQRNPSSLRNIIDGTQHLLDSPQRRRRYKGP